MKRVIKASSFKNIDGYSFTKAFVDKLLKLHPADEDDGYFIKDISNYQGYQILIEGVDSLDTLEDEIIDALNLMNYGKEDTYDITDYENPNEGIVLAVVNGEAFIRLHLMYNYYYDSETKDGIVYLKFDNGNVLFQDWYED